MNVKQFFTGKFLTTADLDGGPQTLEIQRWSVEELPLGGEKLVIWFHEAAPDGKGARGLPLNKSNALALARLFHAEDPDAWIGERIVLFVDPNVQGPGGRRGGVRVRAVGEGNPPRPPLAGEP